MPTNHARFAPSAAERWINCPGSIPLSEAQPPQTGTIYTREGTKAHAIAECALRYELGEIGPEDVEETRARLMPDAEMLEAADLYRDIVMDLLSKAGPGSDLMVEQRLDMSEWVPDGFGTSDAVIVSDDTIQVIDFKYGKGVKVDAEGNAQTRLYGLGALAKFRELYDFQYVRMTIVQPRLDHVTTEELPAAELLRWAQEKVVPATREVIGGDPHYKCGTWCRFCPGKAVCRERANENLKAAQYDFKPPAELSRQEIAEILDLAGELKAWAGDVEDYALSEALRGEKFTGWKLVEGRSNRRISDEERAAGLLLQAGYDVKTVYKPRELQGITALEKAVGKKKLAETLGDLISKPHGRPVLVPESDKRPEFSSAKEDFT